MSITQFNETIKTSLLPKLPAKVLFQIQAVDWVCGALAAYHEGKLLGEEFYGILKSNIIQGRQLFSDYWTKRWEE